MADLLAAAILERDRLRAQRDELLGGIEAHREFAVGGGLGRFHADKRRTADELREREAENDRKLWSLADRIRATTEGSDG